MQINKIHDLRRHLGTDDMTEPSHRRGPVGVINLKATRVMAFLIITLSLVACALVCVLAIWEIVPAVYAWRALGSFGIVAAATAIFVSLNEGFGPGIRD